MNRTAKFSALACALAILATSVASAQKVKSQKEADAINAVVQAPDAAARIKAIESALAQFADTEFKPALQTMMVGAAADMNDSPKVIIYGENVLKTDPTNYQVELWVASATVSGTKEFDLDKEDKLKRADKLATDALAHLVTAAKPNPQITDEQWAAANKQLQAQAHETFGLTATLRKKHDVAIKEYETAMGLAPEASTMVRLAAAYNSAGKPADALRMATQVLASPNLHPAVKQVAEAERDRATKAGAK
jgi:tetratricopeptide (TPR) repeat protein